jgi:hypothetical protein
MKKLRIAQVAPPYEAVPPHKYGGTERVVSYLTEALVARGHDVTLFASGDSTTSARLVPITEQPLRENSTLEELRDLAVPAMLDVVSTVLKHAGDFDIIHWHIDYFPWAFASLVETPGVTTMHRSRALTPTGSARSITPCPSRASLSIPIRATIFFSWGASTWTSAPTGR